MNNKGFTLVETMITLAIMAIFVSLAVPTYKEYILKARVMEAVSIINELNNKVKKCYLNDITISNCEIGESFSLVGSNSGANFYENNFDYTNFKAKITLAEYLGGGNTYGIFISSKNINRKTSKPELEYYISYFANSLFIPTLIISQNLPEGWVKTPNCLVYNKRGDCYDL